LSIGALLTRGRLEERRYQIGGGAGKGAPETFAIGIEKKNPSPFDN
jgi:hypothetical protein